MWVACDTGPVFQLSKSQMSELRDLWTELSTTYPLPSPPETDDEVFAAVLDTWIAGVMSSRGHFTRKSFDDLVNLIDQPGASEVPRSFADRVLALVRSAVDHDE